MKIEVDKMTKIWIRLLLILGLLVFNFATSSDVLCAYMYRDPVKEMASFNVDDDGKESDVSGQMKIMPDNKTVMCLNNVYCYAFWQEDPQNKSQISMLAQGCWGSSDKFDCGSSDCLANKKPPKAMNNTKFCCCSGMMCNVNVTDVYVPTSDEPEITQPASPYKEPVVNKTETAIIVVSGSAFVILVVILVYRCRSGFRKSKPDSLHLMETSPPPNTPTYDLTTLKLQEIIGRGRYGCVWKAKLNDKYVAAKVFPTQHKQYYLNEKYIYTLHHFEHHSLPKFLGSEERMNADGRPEFLIVMSYAPYGCLQDYLRNHVIDWNTLCRMSQSIAKGLAHLHLDVRKGDKIKPCICHRDLNSRNVLVREDLSCFICDMGFAMKLNGSKYHGQNGEEQCAETTSLTDVGTLRYMAPEVLEGAVNLRDCESSLKQIDVYALSLVLWEIMTRCEDLYQGLEVPEYRLPFEAEIGLHPSFEQMQVLVSRNKARPLFSELWKDSNQAVRAIKNTIEESWDQDAEARLTSLCVEERLQELPILWERHKMNMAVTGVSPTVNPTSTRNSALILPGANAITNQDTANIPSYMLLVDLLNPLPRNQTRTHNTADSSTSEATVETIVTTSPSEPLISIPPNVTENSANKNANSQQTMTRATTVPLQPYQGRNPCIERNMIMEPLDEVSVSGNTLLEKGSKFKNSATLNNNNNNNVSNSAARDVDVDNIFEALQATDNVESNSLISNDVLNQSTRTCNPIPYVQNAVHGALPTRPKQPNVPGNGQHYDQKQKKGPFRFDRKKNSIPTEQKSNPKKSKDWGIKSFLDRKRGNKQQQQQQQPANDSNESAINQHRAHSLAKSNLVSRPENIARPVATEVCLLQQNSKDIAQTVTRPMNGLYKSVENGFAPTHHTAEVAYLTPQQILQQSNNDVLTRPMNGLYKSVENGFVPTRHTAEVGVAHLTPTTLQNGQAPIVKHRSSASSSLSGSSGLINCHSETDLPSTKNEPKLKRPTTLPLKGNWSKETRGHVNKGQIRKTRPMDGNQVERAALLANDKSEEQSEPSLPVTSRAKINKRVKTPFKMKTSRFSLYDDRMMDASENRLMNSPVDAVRNCVSLPIDIDSVDTQVKDVSRNDIEGECVHNKHVEGKNGEVLKNGLVVNRWKNDQFNATNSGSDLYQISCL